MFFTFSACAWDAFFSCVFFQNNVEANRWNIPKNHQKKCSLLKKERGGLLWPHPFPFWGSTFFDDFFDSNWRHFGSFSRRWLNKNTKKHNFFAFIFLHSTSLKCVKVLKFKNFTVFLGILHYFLDASPAIIKKTKKSQK